MTQLTLGSERRVPDHRVRALAGVMSAFRWPGKSFDKLKPQQKEAALRAARTALEALEEVE